MYKPGRILLLLGGLAFAVLTGVSRPGLAAEQPVQIVDTEIEDIIRTYATPVFEAAGLDPRAVRIHLLRTSAINAFVAGGQQIFLTTGLLMATRHPGQVIGVIAHETGHIEGGHLARLDRVMRDASTPAMLSNVLAAVVGVLSGNPAAAVAVGTGGNQAITRKLLNYSRVQESAADRAAVRYLEQTGQSARGLREFLQILDKQQLLIVSRREQQELSYEVTHPLTRNRIAYIDQHIRNSQNSDRAVDPDLIRRHRRMVAKLHGFIETPARTLNRYRADDNSLPARYARAIAYYRIPDLEKALGVLQPMIDENPQDPFFAELKGQILFENGHIEEAVAAYETAVRGLPTAPLFRVGLAHAQIELGRADLLRPALAHLKQALRMDPRMPMAWRLAATAHGRLGELGRSYLATAEFSLLTGRRADAVEMSGRAQRRLKKNSPGWLRAEDIRRAARRPR